MKKSEFVKYLKEGFKGMNEISSELFQKSSEKSDKIGQSDRTSRMSNTFFNNFIGKQVFGGEITSIENYDNRINIMVSKIVKNSQSGQNVKKSGVAAIYDINSDQYNVRELTNLTRVDARILQLVALKSNPNTKYKSGIQDLPVAGY